MSFLSTVTHDFQQTTLEYLISVYMRHFSQVESTCDASPLFAELEHETVFTVCTDKNIARINFTLLWGSLMLTPVIV